MNTKNKNTHNKKNDNSDKNNTKENKPKNIKKNIETNNENDIASDADNINDTHTNDNNVDMQQANTDIELENDAHNANNNEDVNYVDIDEDIKSRLKNSVNLFIKYGDEIANLQKNIKELKVKKDECECLILKNLDKLDTSTIEMNGIKLTKNVSETKTACNAEIIKETLEEELKDAKKVESVIEKMEDKREVKERVYLKRSKLKVRSKKQK